MEKIDFDEQVAVTLTLLKLRAKKKGVRVPKKKLQRMAVDIVRRQAAEGEEPIMRVTDPDLIQKLNNKLVEKQCP